MSRRGSILFALCAGAILVRIATSTLSPNLAHPDETFQYLEQAYRLVTGRGLVPWEYAIGARSWILPGLIAPVMKLGLLISSDPSVYLWSVSLFMIALATAGVAAAFVLGSRAGSLMHAGFAGALAAIWCELVYLSPHVLADTLAAVPLIAALALAYRVEPSSARRLAAAGLLFGLAFVFRIQLAPAIAVAMVALCGREIRARYVPMGLGFAGPILLLGIVDWVTLGAPFRSVLAYIRVNSGGIADTFGTAPPLDYVSMQVRLWGIATPLILVTGWFGARKLPLPAIVAGVIFVTFSLIGHKEYRFIYPALPLWFALCGVGTAELVSMLLRSIDRFSTAAMAVGAAFIWLVASVATDAGPVMTSKWRQARGVLEAFRRVNAAPDACGLGLDPPALWYLTGQVRLRPAIGLYAGELAQDPSSDGYNYLLAINPKEPPASRVGAFHLITCGTGVQSGVQSACVYKREGGCDPSQGEPLKPDPGDDVREILLKLRFPPL